MGITERSVSGGIQLIKHLRGIVRPRLAVAWPLVDRAPQVELRKVDHHAMNIDAILLQPPFEAHGILEPLRMRHIRLVDHHAPIVRPLLSGEPRECCTDFRHSMDVCRLLAPDQPRPAARPP